MREQAVERHMQAGELPLGRDAPGLGEGPRQVGFLVEQLRSAVPHAPGLDQQHLGLGAEQVEQGVLAFGQPRQPRLHPVERGALGQSLPLLPPPGLPGDQPRGSGG